MIRLGTRGSELALIQTRRVKSLLPVDSEHEVVESAGDRFKDTDYSEIGGQGVFVRELDARVAEGELDAAVHSMKDMPTDRPEGLEFAAILERDTPYDALVTTDGKGIDELENGAVVGTSSLRRQAQLRRYRDDLEVKSLRGNVDTRVEKLESGEYDAIVLSSAGLERMGIDVPYEHLNVQEFVPSANQGVIAVVAMDETEEFETIETIDDRRTRVVTTAERVVLSRIGGGCVAPMGVFARIQGEEISISAEVLSLDGKEEVKMNQDYPLESYIEGAEKLADKMVEEGAKELVKEAAEEAGE